MMTYHHAHCLWEMHMLTLVYLVAAKMSSNFFFRVCPSDKGQLLSSWCTNMTFSKMACRVVSKTWYDGPIITYTGFQQALHTFETPMSDGTMRSMSAHLYDKACFWPVSLLKVCSVWSSVLNCRAVFFCVSCRDTVCGRSRLTTGRGEFVPASTAQNCKRS